MSLFRNGHLAKNNFEDVNANLKITASCRQKLSNKKKLCIQILVTKKIKETLSLLTGFGKGGQKIPQLFRRSHSQARTGDLPNLNVCIKIYILFKTLYS
jgi:hypothetical protein